MPPVSTTPLAPIANKESLIERFGDWIEGLFHKSEDLYNSLTEAEKKAAVWGSGLISVANTYIESTPDELWTVIQQKFPDLSENVVHGFIDELRAKVDNTQSQIPLTLTDALAWLQAYLKQYHGDHAVLNAISTNAYNIITILLSPETPIEKIIGIGVYVYQLIVKPHVQAAPPVTTPIPEPDPVPTNALIPGTPEFDAAVDAEIARRKANGTV